MKLGIVAAVEKIFSGILRGREYLLPRIDGEYESCESKVVLGQGKNIWKACMIKDISEYYEDMVFRERKRNEEKEESRRRVEEREESSRRRGEDQGEAFKGILVFS